MKHLTIILFLLACGLTAGAQHETLLGNARIRGGFGAPILEYGLGNDLNMSIGGGGGLVINSFFIGAYGLGSTDFEKLFENGDAEVLDIGHGGLWLGGTFQPYRLIHVYSSARVGWGVLNVELDNGSQTYSDLDKIFVLTPELGLELNLTSWFRIAGAVGYRWVRGAQEERGYRNEDFSGGIASVAFRFGWFGRRRQ